MRIIVVGASGDIGQVVCQTLGARHDLIRASRTGGDVQVDIEDRTSVEAMYAKVGTVDAVVCTAGHVHFGPLDEFTTDSFLIGLNNKVMGQVNLVLAGMGVVTEGGSFTLTSGVLDRDPIRMGASAATANGALAGFVTGAAIEMPRGQRLNVVSPGLLEVSVPRYGAWFPGHVPVPSDRVGLAYVKCVEGPIHGQVVVVE